MNTASPPAPVIRRSPGPTRSAILAATAVFWPARWICTGPLTIETKPTGVSSANMAANVAEDMQTTGSTAASNITPNILEYIIPPLWLGDPSHCIEPLFSLAPGDSVRSFAHRRDIRTHTIARGFAQQDQRAELLVQPFNPRGHVDCVSIRSVLHFLVAGSHKAHHHFPGMDAD